MRRWSAARCWWRLSRRGSSSPSEFYLFDLLIAVKVKCVVLVETFEEGELISK